ncbi:peptidoglycan DD-metalloendopeptidase family protein [Sedimentimonas flavescens]|uniref:peptidoglycan DD-metalloendopeptidase family protein n=1 Tax=Sedimentimonas flavescens TaxID=2851012 RepID=UPI0021A6EDF2|nr:peptidoglycan DD-metalloendopeptidase family protein [Sedimentimonas flavescens]MCT2538651.1 peptidoglycan DD-metalloendopeptidase family protein [Sedimentimonas flavescens]
MLAGCAVAAIAGCDSTGTFDADLRNFGQIGFDTSDAARQATAARPTPDARGVISYPNYQVAVARRGDTVASVAARVGADAGELARYNAVSPTAPLREGEVLSLPRRVAESTAPTNTGAIGSEAISITSLASNAIDRAEASAPAAAAKPATPSAEPVRHKVARGETAYSIARYYNVSVRSLAEWNGLPADLSVREGQYLMIPVANAAPPKTASATTQPGQGSPTPTPPSAAKPLPSETPPKASAPVDKSAAPDLGASRTAAAKSKLQMPVQGAVIRPYVKKKNDGIDIAATPGTNVAAAEAGKVLLLSQDTEKVYFVGIKHANGLVTIYYNVTDIQVKKGDDVKRGQTIAKVAPSQPGYLHFEVRQGLDSLDPMPYLQ